jgi:hypothetical protein
LADCYHIMTTIRALFKKRDARERYLERYE